MSNEIEFSLYDDKGNEHKYTLNKFFTSEGIKIQARLLKILLPCAPFFLALKNIFIEMSLKTSTKESVDTSEENKQIKELSGFITDELLNALNAENLVDLSKLLIKGASRDGVMVTAEKYEIIYQANYGELYSLIKKVIEVNFSSVLSMLKKSQKA